MLKKIIEKTKALAVKTKDTAKVVALALVIAYQTVPMNVYAAGGGAGGGASYLTPINNLKIIFIAVIAAAGVIVLGYGGVKFAISFQKMDQNGEHQAIYTVIAGALMLGISAVMTALGA